MTEAPDPFGAPGLPLRLRPKPLEVACGLVLGPDPEAAPLDTRPNVAPRAAIDTVIRQALARPPCLVSFSGGRDSSAVLAAATAVARRDGLPLPVPTTYRFAGAPGSDETEWQEQVIRHLDLPHWERLAMTAEVDTVGPVAQAVLLRHGLYWPFNAHFHVPVLQRAAGGSLLTGIGGDELFLSHLWASARTLMSGRHRQRRVRLRSVGVALAPRAVRRWVLSRHRRQRFPWLQPAAEDDVTHQLADWRARSPLAWEGGVAWLWRSRYRSVLAATMDMLAADTGTRIVHPFLEESVAGAVARHFGRPGPLDRSAAMRELFGDVLPDAVSARRSKAHFNGAFIARHTRAFAAGWTGAGVDDTIVDADRLSLEWRAEHPDPRSFMLMQAVWLADATGTTG